MKVLVWKQNENGAWTQDWEDQKISLEEAIKNLHTNVIEGWVPELEVPIKITLPNGKSKYVTMSRLNREAKLLEQYYNIERSPNLTEDKKRKLKQKIRRKLMFKTLVSIKTIKQYKSLLKEILLDKSAK